MRNIFQLAVIFVTCLSAGAVAQGTAQTADFDNITGAPFVVPGAKVHTVQSSIVGQLYELRVAVPGDYYARPDKDYPVVYVLDGQWNFTIMADIGGKLSYDGMTPEFITVGITWGGEDANPGVLRMRDFTPSVNPFMPVSGGAEQFLNALESEIIPFTETLYRVNGRRTLVGASLGGLFASYAMLQKPNLFSGYIALSAPYDIEQAYFGSRLAQLAGSQSLEGARLYLSVGSLDLNRNQVQAFSQALEAHDLGVRTKFKLVKGVGHAGVEPIAYTFGLQHIFERPKLQLHPRVLDRYLGIYESDLGFPPVTVVRHKRQLQLQQEGAPSLNFVADTETTFYVNGIDYTLSFTESEDGAMMFTIEVQGTPYTFTRTAGGHARD